ncbi:MarR family transcriptional regulator [Catellatospora methionotrophica]|uniref:MarR family transcriptional regulator n=2 Tax=Catellatospora methionotrophica TaxID=121620 RepID=A0A8J3L9E1_9ACTN|nr:MarR family transcriptional regulator [Catellatospora methionotrophica]
MALDRALIRLRRFLEPPGTMPDGGQNVDLSTLLVVDAIAAAPQPVTISAVADALDVTHSTASRLVSRAVSAGAVQRLPDGDDRRQADLGLTSDGAALHERAVGHRLARLARLLTDFTPEQTRQFAGLLSRFADAASRRPPERPSPGKAA